MRCGPRKAKMHGARIYSPLHSDRLTNLVGHGTDAACASPRNRLDEDSSLENAPDRSLNPARRLQLPGGSLTHILAEWSGLGAGMRAL